MKHPFPGFLGASYTSRTFQADAEWLMNFFIQKMESPNAKSRYVLAPTPGLDPLLDVLNNTKCRAKFATNGRVFQVVGNGFYEEFENGTFTLRGTVAVDGFPATISSNGGGQLFITSGDKGYVFNLSSAAWAEVLANGARSGGVLNSIFLAYNAALGEVRFSRPSDGLTWDPLDTFQRSIASDTTKALGINNYGEAMLMGETTSEVWTYTGDPSNPFAPRSNLVIPWGILAPWSFVSDDTTTTWMARNKAGGGQIVAASGYNPTPVSDVPLAEALSSFRTSSRIDDAEAWGYEDDDGHPNYVLNLPTANVTKVLDRKLGVWHDRGTWNVLHHRYDRWAANWHCYEWNRHLVGDASSGRTYRLSGTYGYDAGGAPIRRVRRTPALFNMRTKLFYPAFEVYLDTGIGTVSGQGEDPTIVLNVSDNGGKTWWSAGARSAGRMGQFDQPVVWDCLGPSYNRVLELVMTDPVPYRIVDAYQWQSEVA